MYFKGRKIRDLIFSSAITCTVKQVYMFSHLNKTEQNQASSPEKTLFSVLPPGAYYFMYECNSQIELKRFTSVYWHAIQSINQSINQ